jgi:hypothetical protein
MMGISRRPRREGSREEKEETNLKRKCGGASWVSSKIEKATAGELSR